MNLANLAIEQEFEALKAKLDAIAPGQTFEMYGSQIDFLLRRWHRQMPATYPGNFHRIDWRSVPCMIGPNKYSGYHIIIRVYLTMMVESIDFDYTLKWIDPDMSEDASYYTAEELHRLAEIEAHKANIELSAEASRRLMEDNAFASVVLDFELRMFDRKKRYLQAAEQGVLVAENGDELFGLCTTVYDEEWRMHMLRIVRLNGYYGESSLNWYRGQTVYLTQEAWEAANPDVEDADAEEVKEAKVDADGLPIPTIVGPLTPEHLAEYEHEHERS